jgi:hypothetical protein
MVVAASVAAIPTRRNGLARASSRCDEPYFIDWLAADVTALEELASQANVQGRLGPYTSTPQQWLPHFPGSARSCRGVYTALKSIMFFI